jgi:small subunit ribosomal protein S17
MSALRLLKDQGGRLLQSSSALFGNASHTVGSSTTARSGSVAARMLQSPVTMALSRPFSTSYDISSTLNEEVIPKMTNEELVDTSTIPGWDLIHSPPRKFPRGALVGTVVSNKMQKTVNVAVDRYRIVPKIRKRVKYTRKFMAHDEKEVATTGDLVMITPCHRLSKHKHFMLREIIRPKGQL